MDKKIEYIPQDDEHFTSKEFLKKCGISWEMNGVRYPANALPSAEMEAEADRNNPGAWLPVAEVGYGAQIPEFLSIVAGDAVYGKDNENITVKGMSGVLGSVTLKELREMFE